MACLVEAFVVELLRLVQVVQLIRKECYLQSFTIGKKYLDEENTLVDVVHCVELGLTEQDQVEYDSYLRPNIEGFQCTSFYH